MLPVQRVLQARVSQVLLVPPGLLARQDQREQLALLAQELQVRRGQRVRKDSTDLRAREVQLGLLA